jgi:predicted DCC family thiol-disulfide oxidoreductase YuxK
VLFIIDRDPGAHFRFASLQSTAGREALAARGRDPGELDSIVLIDSAGAWRESDAVLRIAAGLKMPWRLLSAFRVVPRPLRDAAYRLIARNRYRWFGHDVCRVPTPALRARLVPEGAFPQPEAGSDA